MRPELVPLGETGIPLGDHHHLCRVTDEQVAEMRDLHEREGLGWRSLAKRFPHVTASNIRHIIYYTRRNVVPRQWVAKTSPA